MKEFNSQVCTTKEQSQHLLELGLKPETADMCHTTFYRDNVGYEIIQVRNEKLPLLSQEIPAWSLHRLIELGCFNVECKGIFWKVTGTYFSESCDKIYDTIIDSIEALITEDLFNKEYLKQ
jgi:hypothetical protein